MEKCWLVEDAYLRKAANVRLRFDNRTYGPPNFPVNKALGTCHDTYQIF